MRMPANGLSAATLYYLLYIVGMAGRKGAYFLFWVDDIGHFAEAAFSACAAIGVSLLLVSAIKSRNETSLARKAATVIAAITIPAIIMSMPCNTSLRNALYYVAGIGFAYLIARNGSYKRERTR